MSVLSLTIPGKITSANMVKTPFARRAVKTEGARYDAARVKSIVFAAVKTQRWQMPAQASVHIVAYNSRLDCGNIEKIPVDSLKGLAIVNDSPKHLRRLLVEHAPKDALGERYTVTVEAIE